VTGAFSTFGHFVTLSVLDYDFDVMGYFAADPYPRNVLGQVGWIDRVRFGLIHYERELYVSQYDE